MNRPTINAGPNLKTQVTKKTRLPRLLDTPLM